ncbi:peptidoglycan DD-metalloendopeptidase family protein [Patescibacteria group bacterium]|nr:peptidoglycan DD-metalloendopeptidase family protein [Patescibacteria group bacterium]
MKKFVSLILISLLVFAPFALADDTGSTSDSADKVLESEPVKVNDTEVVDSEVINQAVKESTLLVQLKKHLAQSRYRYFVLQNNMEVAKEGLVQLEDTVAVLEEEIVNLNDTIDDTMNKIRSVKTQVERGEMEISDIEEEVLVLELQFEDQKEVVQDLMRLLYVKRDVFYDDEGVNPVKVLVSPDSISETLQKVTYLNLIENENQSQIKKLADLDFQLKGKRNDLREKRTELDRMDSELKEELQAQVEERNAKQNVLNETKEEKLIYESMLVTADEKAEDIQREIEIYEENVKIMEGKMMDIRSVLTEDQQAIIDQIETDALENFAVSDAASSIDLQWPVSPGKGLTAFFSDSNYVRVFGVQHHAVDIRANQGSTIFAPADGVVYKVVFKENSTNYAYVMIAHRKGVMTVVGHVSEPLVEPGEYVKQGQIIALSGGTPNTVGSGYRTTGPHVHFEVWQSGVLVDPLLYLPLEEVPVNSLPEQYVKMIQEDMESTIKDLQNALLQSP